MHEYSKNILSEKELEIVSYLANNSDNSQRAVSFKLGYSLGITNIILQRLIKTGYIKTRQLNRKKFQYILTPKGFLEKTKKSYNFYLNTINSIKHIKDSIKHIIMEAYEKGARTFYIVGNSELTAITELVLREIAHEDIHYSKIDISAALPSEGFLLNTDIQPLQLDNDKKCVNIIEELSRA
jgi:hypothetical protein